MREDEGTLALIERARAGDEIALNDLFVRYLPRLHRWARGWLGEAARDGTDAIDLVQDVACSTFSHITKVGIRDEASVEAYLRQALRNRVRDHWRRAESRPPLITLSDEDMASESSPLGHAIGRESRQRFMVALRRLRRHERRAIFLRLHMGHSYREIAQASGARSADAARMMVGRALARVAEEMKRSW